VQQVKKSQQNSAQKQKKKSRANIFVQHYINDTRDQPEHQALDHAPTPSPSTSTPNHSSDTLQYNCTTKILTPLSHHHKTSHFNTHSMGEIGLAGSLGFFVHLFW